MHYSKICCIIFVTIFLYSNKIEAQKADACRDVSIVDLGKGMNRREFLVHYTPSSSCQPTSMYVSCDNKRHVLVNDTFTMLWLTSSSSYYCNGSLVSNGVMSNEKAIFQFTTDDGITLTSNSSDAITVTLQYDGGRDYDSFQIKIDENPHTVQLGVPLTIENLSICQEYSFASYLLLGSERVHLGSRTGVILMKTLILYVRNKGHFSAELGVQSDCGGLDAVLMCNDLEIMKFKLADYDDKRTFLKLQYLMSGHKYYCYVRVGQQQSPTLSFVTKESLSFETYEGGSVLIRFESDEYTIYHKFYIQIGDEMEMYITPNIDMLIDNLQTCRTYVVKLFGMLYDSTMLLEEKTLKTKPDVPSITNAYVGYYKAAFEVKLPRDTNCIAITAALHCNSTKNPIEFKFNPENSAVVVRNNLNDDSKYSCNAQVNFGEYGQESSEWYLFETKESFVLEGRDNDKIVARFIYDDNVYHNFYLGMEIDYEIFPEIEVVIFDRDPCVSYYVRLFGVSATDSAMLASKTIIIANATAAPKILTSKPGAYQYTLEIQIPSYGVCPIIGAKLHCNHSLQPLPFDVTGNSTLITLSDVSANMTHKCHATIQIRELFQEVIGQEYSFKTEPALLASSKTPQEITAKFSYDGPWHIESFTLYVDGVATPIKLDQETIVKNLISGQAYRLEVYSQLDFKAPEMFLASQIVVVR